MTGYGDAEGQLDGVTYIVEIKSVNNRYFKPRIKLPESVAFLEEDIYKLLSNNISRGAVDYVLRLRNISADMLYDINMPALETYLTKLKEATDGAGMAGALDASSLLSLPGILEPRKPDEDKIKQVTEIVMSLSDKAIEQLKNMRQTEGAELQAELVRHCKVIEEKLGIIEGRKDMVLSEYHDKLGQRIDRLLADGKLKLDKEILAREVAVFAERCDICEELARLTSHIKQFEDSCESDRQAGRKLDFIAQEMLREANTIASKSADVEIAHHVVDIKCSIDRLKEQIQNVE